MSKRRLTTVAEVDACGVRALAEAVRRMCDSVAERAQLMRLPGQQGPHGETIVLAAALLAVVSSPVLAAHHIRTAARALVKGGVVLEVSDE